MSISLVDGTGVQVCACVCVGLCVLVSWCVCVCVFVCVFSPASTIWHQMVTADYPDAAVKLA
jgi:hypothetical protein